MIILVMVSTISFEKSYKSQEAVFFFSKNLLIHSKKEINCAGDNNCILHKDGYSYEGTYF